MFTIQVMKTLRYSTNLVLGDLNKYTVNQKGNINIKVVICLKTVNFTRWQGQLTCIF